MKIIITGSEGLLGKEISKFLEKDNNIIKLDLLLGHDLTDEKFVKKWFKNNRADGLVNCFALNDHVDSKRAKSTLYNITLDSFSEFLDVNITSLFSVCREFARNNKKAVRILESLKAEGTPEPLVLNALFKGLEREFKMSKTKSKNKEEILKAFKKIALIDSCIKGFNKQDPWLGIRELTLSF